MSPATIDAVDSLQATLEPFEALKGEQSQLESWVHDSFSALEKLHSELTEWQSELARKQTELDLREDVITRGESETVSGDAAEQIAHWKRELNDTREESQQLEEENAEQLQVLDNLELQLVQIESELKTALKRNTELSQLLETERSRASEEQHQWQDEFRDMRRLLEKQYSLLEGRIRDSRDTPDAEEGDVQEPTVGESDTTSRAAELRRRAKSRRAAKLRKHQDAEQQEQSEQQEQI